MPINSEPARKHILLVEDDELTRSALAWLLLQAGYQVVPVASVAESYARLDGQHYAILDLNLPDGLGTSVLKRIRDEQRPLRVAITTACENGPLLDEARRLRPELILRKPINLNELLKWLKSSG